MSHGGLNWETNVCPTKHIFKKHLYIIQNVLITMLRTKCDWFGCFCLVRLQGSNQEDKSIEMYITIYSLFNINRWEFHKPHLLTIRHCWRWSVICQNSWKSYGEEKETLRRSRVWFLGKFEKDFKHCEKYWPKLSRFFLPQKWVTLCIYHYRGIE